MHQEARAESEGGMISIRDEDKKRLEEAVRLLDDYTHKTVETAKEKVERVLINIDDLMLPAPTIDPRLAPMTETDRRMCYPERFSK